MQTEKGYKPYILLEGQTNPEQAGDLIWAKVETAGRTYVGGAVLNGCYWYQWDELIYLFDLPLNTQDEIDTFGMLYPNLVRALPEIKAYFDLYRDITL